MELTSSHFGLTSELMEYLVKGDGTYAVSDSETHSNLISVTVKLAREENGEVYATQQDDEPVQFFADIHFVLNDETRGTVQVCFAPLSVMLVNFKSVKLQEGDILEEKLAGIKEEIESAGPTMNHENTTLWSKCLMNYVSKGLGVHDPNMIDSMLGMTKVTVKWSEDLNLHKLFDFGNGDALIYQCQIAYGTEENTMGSVCFQVMPYEISFSS